MEKNDQAKANPKILKQMATKLENIIDGRYGQPL